MKKTVLAFLFSLFSAVNANAQALSVSPAGGGSPGGSDLQLQYNNAGAFGGMAGTSWDDTNRSLTITGATVTTSHPVLELSQTWNNAATTFTGLSLNITDTTSNAASILFSVIRNAAVSFSVSRAGNATVLSDIISSSVTGRLLLRNGGTFVSSPANAQIQLGSVDGPVVVAQTLRVQGSTGTDTAGAATFTIIGPQATGNAAPGDIVLKTGVVGASGTAASVPTTALTIKGATQNVEFAAQAIPKSYTVAALPTGVEGGLVNVSDQLTACPVKGGTFTGGGAVTCLAHFEEGAWVSP